MTQLVGGRARMEVLPAEPEKRELIEKVKSLCLGRTIYNVRMVDDQLMFEFDDRSTLSLNTHGGFREAQ